MAENLYIGREPLTKLWNGQPKGNEPSAAVLMKQLELDVDVTRNLEEYSLALQQMIAIARAVDMDCKVLILDEPTSSLDDREVEKAFYHDAQTEGERCRNHICYPFPGTGLCSM